GPRRPGRGAGRPVDRAGVARPRIGGAPAAGGVGANGRGRCPRRRRGGRPGADAPAMSFYGRLGFAAQGTALLV
ncbi:MAG: hypothetical protein AVDCRST_MAG08-3227, partial [uncultured Acetobacteraceae bacterium]